jgi:O-antigen ligase
VVGIYQFFGGSGAPHLWILNYEYFRAFGTFGQPNPFGAFMGLSLPLALGMAYGQAQAALNAYAVYRQSHERRGRDRLIVASGAFILALAAAALLGAGLLVSWSRGAWLGFAAAFVVLLLFAPRRRWVGAALVVLVVAGLWASIVTGLAPDSLVARITDFAQDLTGFEDVRGRAISDENYAVVERLAHWQAAISMASESPWLGVGFGNYEIVYPRHALVNWPLALGHAHNYYLNLLAETGIVGLVAYLLAWTMIVALTVRILRRHAGLWRGIALGLLGAWAHLAVHSLFDKLYVNNLFLHLGAMLGLIGVLSLAGGLSPARPVDESGSVRESRDTTYAAYRAHEPE